MEKKNKREEQQQHQQQIQCEAQIKSATVREQKQAMKIEGNCWFPNKSNIWIRGN